MSAKVAGFTPEKGERKGGRQKGTPNKSKEVLRSNLRTLYGDDFCAVSKIAHNAVILQHRVDTAERDKDSGVVSDAGEPEKGATLEMLRETIAAWDKVASYTEPKLKAIEVTAENEPNTSEKARERLGELVAIGAGRSA